MRGIWGVTQWPLILAVSTSKPQPRRLFIEKPDPLVADVFTASRGHNRSVGLTLDLDEQRLHITVRPWPKACTGKGYSPRRPGGSRPPLIPTTVCLWLRTDWNRMLRQTPKPEMGMRNLTSSDRQRLAVSGLSDRSIFAHNDRPGHGQTYEGEAGL